MVDVFEQVEEELRSERYKRLARTWLPVAGGVLLIALIAALSFWGWDSWQTSKADKASVAYDRGLESLQAGNPVGADAAFLQAVNEGNGAYKAMALVHRAGIALDANRVPEALRLLDEAAGASSDPLLSDPAAYKAALLALDIETLAQVEARLEPLARNGRPLSAFALETLAMARLQHGQVAPAREAFVLLKNGLDTPEIVSQRADLAIAAIDSGAAENLKKIVDAQAAIPVPAAPQPAGPATSAGPATPTRP
ncbi:MAG: tetratricopeptide repeat protein [Brevundimonas sp.]|uniref:tetratricopeptide repeat protein n=1 Tax=Brevundimonas sp. TaxID=1871086 RepID=UPI00271E9BC7|nr:tetratricopeptide repeat protein [Brevundimonas sp.]MDO9588288.1 tetratricopeptide repeat protein [Brevundimonas sp.]MDP3370152.1 tetratricopeptide repeat protein [Brevundimonas sp.]MDP3656893.1 tetratricopeptide repeat protein [Brevundimonas sp.]MDZ4108780.1 tetratricopeptide repeat protein [Brevundimonas sp.]